MSLEAADAAVRKQLSMNQCLAPLFVAWEVGAFLDEITRFIFYLQLFLLRLLMCQCCA